MLDFKHPLSPIQAFGIAISVFAFDAHVAGGGTRSSSPSPSPKSSSSSADNPKPRFTRYDRDPRATGVIAGTGAGSGAGATGSDQRGAADYGDAGSSASGGSSSTGLFGFRASDMASLLGRGRGAATVATGGGAMHGLSGGDSLRTSVLRFDKELISPLGPPTQFFSR